MFLAATALLCAKPLELPGITEESWSWNLLLHWFFYYLWEGLETFCHSLNNHGRKNAPGEEVFVRAAQLMSPWIILWRGQQSRNSPLCSWSRLGDYC